MGDDGLARAVVAYRDGVVPDSALDLLDELGVVRGLELSSIGAVAVTAPRAVVELLVATDPRVVAVAPQRRLQLDLYASKGQLHANDMDTPEDYTYAGRSGTRPGVTGAGVTVAVLDSGIFSAHPDFGDRVTTGLHFEFSEIEDSGGISPEQWDDYAESTGAVALQDEIGHGTHVASTVGGSGAMSADAGGPNLAGLAPGVELVSMKVADAPFGIVEDIDWEEAALAAFDYIIRHPELSIDIAQNSWGLLPTEPNCQGLDCGEPTDFDAMADMIGAVEDAGVTVVFSAGNDGPEPGTIGAYHRADQAILVGAACKSPDGSCPEGEVTDFSSRGAADGDRPAGRRRRPGRPDHGRGLAVGAAAPDRVPRHPAARLLLHLRHVHGVPARLRRGCADDRGEPRPHPRAGHRLPPRHGERPARARRRPRRRGTGWSTRAPPWRAPTR